jgi:D-alanine--poly(phosphoribitol) ligase subunit 2
MEQVPRRDIVAILTNELGLGADVVTRGALMTAGALESFDFVRLVSLLEERFAIEIASSLIIPSNFDSVDSMAALVEDLREGGVAQSAVDLKASRAKVRE